jgi:hypothetical protein
LVYRRKTFEINGSTQVCAATFKVCGLEFIFTFGEPQFDVNSVRPLHHPHRINYKGTSIVFSWPPA